MNASLWRANSPTPPPPPLHSSLHSPQHSSLHSPTPIYQLQRSRQDDTEKVIFYTELRNLLLEHLSARHTLCVLRTRIQLFPQPRPFMSHPIFKFQYTTNQQRHNILSSSASPISNLFYSWCNGHKYFETARKRDYSTSQQVVIVKCFQ